MSTPKNIEELLNRLNKQTPFTVPEGYFEELEEKVIQTVKEEENVEKAKIPFEVPQGYFDGLADKVMAKVDNNPAISIWHKPMTVAASVAVLLMVSLGIYYIKLPSKTQQTADISFNDISTEELYAAIEDEVEMDLVAEVLDLEENTTISATDESAVNKDTLKQEKQTGEVDERVNEVETEQLEEYLLENIEDLYIDEI